MHEELTQLVTIEHEITRCNNKLRRENQPTPFSLGYMEFWEAYRDGLEKIRLSRFVLARAIKYRGIGL